MASSRIGAAIRKGTSACHSRVSIWLEAFGPLAGTRKGNNSQRSRTTILTEGFHDPYTNIWPVSRQNLYVNSRQHMGVPFFVGAIFGEGGLKGNQNRFLKNDQQPIYELTE